MKEQLPRSGLILLAAIVVAMLLTFALMAWSLIDEQHPSPPPAGTTPDLPVAGA